MSSNPPPPPPQQPPPGTIAYVPGMDIVSGQSYWFPPGTGPPAHLLFSDQPAAAAAAAPVIIPSLSAAARRLHWTLQGPLESPGVLSVMPADLDPDGPREPFFTGDNNRHAIAEQSLTLQPVNSITVHEENLKDWRDEWYTINQVGLDDEDDDDNNDNAPPEINPLTILATSNGACVTIIDYVSALHPWLMARREEILRARNVAEGEDYAPTGEERLLVNCHNPELVHVEDEDEWMASLRWGFANGGGGGGGAAAEAA